nr:multiple inositol polyphosphate phosphatase 1 isoform X2 [Halyomorpha halys]
MDNMVGWLLAGLICFSLQGLATADTDPYCFSDDHDPYNLFATKTAYEVVRDKRLKIGVVPDCTPVMIWGLFRHGTRYPHEDEIKQQMGLSTLRDTILRNSPQDMDMCNEDIDLLKDWSYNVNMSEADLLTESGVTELQLLAKRLRSNFPDVLNAHYTEERFKIRYTSKERTKQSAEAFTTELFGGPIGLSENFIDDDLLEPNHNCSVWKTSTQSEGLKRETEKFRNSKMMNSLIHKVGSRMGFKYNLTGKTMHDIYDMCRFDKAWNFKTHSPWCSPFEKHHLKVMEYDEDLDYYYRSGYGNPFTAKLGCPLIRDMIETLNSRTQVNTTEESTGPSAVFNFAHSLTLRAALIKLGIAKDNYPITADTFSTSEKRQWRTAFLTPFAGNLLAVLYKCADQQYRVMFFLNEQYVEYERCKVGLCDWSYIYSTFKSEIDPSRCNRDFCETSGSSLVVPTIMLMGLVLLNMFTRFY